MSYRRESNSLKEACQKRPQTAKARRQLQFQKYQDTMSNALHTNIQENIFPHWRNHRSLKGWCSMNYPKVITNPLLAKYKDKNIVKQEQEELQNKQFNNQERPVSAPNINLQRPFSAKMPNLFKFKGENQSTKRLESAQKYGLQIDEKGLTEMENLIVQTQNVLPPINDNQDPQKNQDLQKQETQIKENESNESDRSKDANLQEEQTIQQVQQFQDSKLPFGKSIGQSVTLKQSGSAINSIEAVFAAMPVPKKSKKAKKKKVVVEVVEDEKDKSEPRKSITPPPANKSSAEQEKPKPVSPRKKASPKKKEPEPVEPPKPREPISVNEALSTAQSWKGAKILAAKSSSGVTTTRTYLEKTKNFEKTYAIGEKHSSILPMSNYFGQTPDQNKDPFDKRTVQQLDDISFEEDSEPEFEDIAYQKRMPGTILTEETLKKILGPETTKLNLENHYWLKDNFCNKISRLSANLVDLRMRRMKISDQSFEDIFVNLTKLEKIDLSECPFLREKSLTVMFEKNTNFKEIELYNSAQAVTDNIMYFIANLKSQLIELDISHSTRVTDAGMQHFEDKKMQIQHLRVSGLTNISSQGLSHLISACRFTLVDLEAAYMDQPEMVNLHCQAIAKCWSLQTLDFAGNKFFDDNGINMLMKGTIQEQGKKVPTYPGLKRLKVVKFNGAELLNGMNFDSAIIKFLQGLPCIEHLEVNNCTGFIDSTFKEILTQCKSLKFLDLNGIPAITYPIFEELKELRPELMIKRYANQVADPKDNGLRVPRRLIKKKKKKGKKKGKKKKK